jgi:4-carboxymuconolactone decarboxylase
MSKRVFAAGAGMCALGIASLLLASQAPQAAAVDTSNLRLVGDRFAPMTWDQMNEAQKKMTIDTLTGPRRGLGGPFNVLLRSPEMGDLAMKFGEYSRFRPEVPAKLRELAIIVTARHWTSHFEWNAHRNAAAQAGLSADIITAIANRKRPAGMQPDEEAVYNFASELLENKQVSDATFKSVKDKFGEKGVVDIIGIMGWYQMVSMVLNVDRYPLPAGVQQELK